LLRRPNGHLTWAEGVLHVLEAGDLYRIDSTRVVLAGARIRGFVGSDTLSMTCTEDGRLTVSRAGQPIAATTCVPSDVQLPMAARGQRYVALQTPTALTSDRGTIALPFAIKGEYAVALGDDGLIALGDLSGDAWIVRPDSVRVESVARRGAHPTSIAAAGSLVAFGYSDGVVIAVDTATDLRWEFTGHADAVFQIVIDAAHRRVVSAASELRVWQLRVPALTVAGALPCVPFHIVAVGDSGRFATDCNDGRALLWSPDNKQVSVLHAHRDLAFGIAIYRGAVCTGGWDGRVLCTSISDGKTTEMLASGDRVKSLVSCQTGIFATTEGGAVWSLEGGPRVLYTHHVTSHRLDVDARCTRLVSGAYDGSLIVYDLIRGNIETQLASAHTGQITRVAIQQDSVLSSGLDAVVRRWHPGTAQEHAVDIQLSGPVTDMRTSTHDWAATVDDRIFVFHSTNSPSATSLVLRHSISDIAISPNERYLAVADLDEIVVVDRERDRVAVAQNPTSDINCIRFADNTNLLACDASTILSLSIERLKFSPMNSSGPEQP
jgi:WD40 repeat protein